MRLSKVTSIKSFKGCRFMLGLKRLGGFYDRDRINH